MFERHRKLARSHSTGGGKELETRKTPVVGLLRPAGIMLAVVVVAAVAWIALGSSDKVPPSQPAVEAPPESQALVSNQPDAGVPATGTPKIVFPETSYDFGAITQGSSVSHVFVVRNAGDAPLTLIEVGGS